MLVPTDDRTWAFSRGNSRATGGTYLNGTDTRTSRTGATMTIRFTGSSFVLIGTTAVGHGRLRVSIDGHACVVDEGYYGGFTCHEHPLRGGAAQQDAEQQGPHGRDHLSRHRPAAPR